MYSSMLAFTGLNFSLFKKIFIKKKIFKKLCQKLLFMFLKTLFLMQVYLYINLACLFVCLFICLFVSNKCQNGWTDRAQTFCGTSRDRREGLWMIKISNMCLHQNSIFIKFFKILKIHQIFCENPRIIFVLFYDVHKEIMFTINLEDGREAPSKACLVKSQIKNLHFSPLKIFLLHKFT